MKLTPEQLASQRALVAASLLLSVVAPLPTSHERPVMNTYAVPFIVYVEAATAERALEIAQDVENTDVLSREAAAPLPLEIAATGPSDLGIIR